ncbi:MAG: phosphate ABC transporter substrate-binding protein PstS, partial [Tepidisphaeraceae bacterium]
MFQFLRAAAVVLATGAGMAMADVSLKGEGATFPKPLYDVWVSKFHEANPDIAIDYQGSGSGGGIKAITNKTVDFAGSDVKMSKREAAEAGDVVYIPACAGAVVAAYNLPGFSGELKLSGPVLADIYLGNITNWNDGKIAALNPGASLPNQAITPVYRSDGSGTNAVFSTYLSTQSDEFSAKVGAGKSVQWPVGQGAQANNGVTTVVKDVSGAIGYIELNYALANDVTMATLENKAGKFVKPSLDSVTAAAAAATEIPANIMNRGGDNAYPIASFTYILVHKDLSYLGDKAKVDALVKFLTWAQTEGQKLAPDHAYPALPDAVTRRAMANIHSLTFNGSP